MPSGDGGCDILGLTFDSSGNVLDKSGKPESGFTRDGIGFSYYYSGYSDVMVYYFPSYGSWYPVAYSTFDGTNWEYTYAPSSWYFYVYY